jgi:hypothetical protein
MECLPKGGTLSVKAGNNAGESLITASGPDANIRGQTARALSGDLHRDALEPKYVHPYITGLLAKTYGFSVSIGDSGADSVTITLICPAV